MTLATKIRFNAAMRVRVKITKKRRNKTGFWVWFPDGKGGLACELAKTKREAESKLLAKVRTTVRLFFLIEPARMDLDPRNLCPVVQACKRPIM
jgi:hypothetical protein